MFLDLPDQTKPNQQRKITVGNFRDHISQKVSSQTKANDSTG